MNEQDFLAAVRSAGMNPPAAIEPERFYRFPGIEKSNGNTAGWCKLFADGTGGIYGDWSSDFSESWRAERHEQMTPAEREAFRRHVEQARAQAESERKAMHAKAAEKATAIWGAAEPASDDHPYLKRKGAKAHGLCVYRGHLVIRDMSCDGCLIVPMRDARDAISSLQFIRDGGDKRFLPGGDYKGRYYIIGEPGEVVCVCEGFATGASIHEATGYAVAVAFTASNLEPVARALRERRPDLKLVVCADDDHKTDGNPGLAKAREAAQAVNGVVAVPDFGTDRPQGATDFNDLAQLRGLEVVARTISEALATRESASASEANGPNDESIADAIARLAKLSPIDYERVRDSESETLGVRVSVLDKEVCKARGNKDSAQGQAVSFLEVEPWPEPVAAAQLFDQLAAMFRRYVVLPDHGDVGLALWVAFTWLIDEAAVAPILALTSPEKRCGKTTLLALLRQLVYHPLPVSNISPASLFRCIEAWKPTLLIDEADKSFSGESDELRCLMNSGHTRDLAFVIRNVGEDHEPRRFSTWGAKAIALIGNLPDTLADRAVSVQLRRKLQTETVEKLRHAPAGGFGELARMLARFAADNVEVFRRARPLLPTELNDRAADNWEPLLAIADIAGHDWPKKARAAALHLSGNTLSETESLRVSLLKDIRQLFAEKGVDRLASADLVEELRKLEERPWVEIYYGKGLTQNRLAKILNGFDIVSRSVRLENGRTPKGYLLESFQDAFDRYLQPGEGGFQSATPTQANRDAACGEISKRNAENVWRIEKPSKPAPVADCVGVAVQKGGDGGDEEYEAF